MAVGSETYLFDFDHRDPSAKTFNVSQMNDRSVAEIEAEIAKCDLRCALCHRRRTHSESHWGRPRLRVVDEGDQLSFFGQELAS